MIVIGSHEPLKIGEIIQDRISNIKIGEHFPEQPYRIMSEATKEDWLKYLKEELGHDSNNPNHRDINVEPNDKFYWVSTD